MLSNNNMLTTGGNRGPRQRRSVRVNKPAVGFFITGSCVDAMNGVYVARNPPRVLAGSSDPVAALYYEHEDKLWHLSLNELAGAEEEEEEEEEEDERHYWREPKAKKPTHEWVFSDELGRQRFMHDGDTIIPGAGVRWKHIHRQATAATSRSSVNGTASSSAVATIEEDNEDELPWQVIAILDVETVQDLLWSSQCRREKIREAKAGRTAEPPGRSSLEGSFTPGAWLFRVKTADGVKLFVEPDEGSEEAGRREVGEYVKGVEMSKDGEWLHLDSCEDTDGHHFNEDDDEDRYFRRTHAGGRARHYNRHFARRQLWVKVCADGWAGTFSLLEEVKSDDTAVLELRTVGDSDNLTSDIDDAGKESPPVTRAALLGGYTGDYFDQPFVPRMEDGTEEDGSRGVSVDETIVEVDSLMETLSGKKDGTTQDDEAGGSGSEVAGFGVPVGSAVMMVGLSTRGGRQYNGVEGVVVQRLDAKTGRQGVRLDAPFSGKLLSCRLENMVFRQDSNDDDEEEDLEDDDASSDKPLRVKAAVRRAARLLGLPLGLIGVRDGTENNTPGALAGGAWGFAGATPQQRVGSALRSFLRLDGSEYSGDVQDLGREAAKLLLSEISQQNNSHITDATLPCTPVRYLCQGALGGEVAAVASAAISPHSASERTAGVKALQQSVTTEKIRVRREKEAIYSLHETADLEDSKGGDELLLRLALVQTLLENRREAEALEEAKCVVKFEADFVSPSSTDSTAAVSYLLGCCLLRLGMRAHGLTALENAKIVELPLELRWLSPVQAWAAAEAEKLLLVHSASEKCKHAAVESYARGSFEDAAALYRKAFLLLEKGCAEDKRGRALCLADRAGCLRRARKLDEAVEDLDHALRLFPRYTRALFRRAACLLEAGRASDAVEGFKALYRVDRDWPHLNEWLIRAYSLQKRQSRGDYRSADSESTQQYDNPKDEKDTKAGETVNGDSEADRIAKEVDHYAVLGVSTDATEKQLKTAYRMRSLKFHPDKKGGHTAAFQRIADAYQTLSTPEKRQAYDEGKDIKVKRGRRDEDDDSEDSEEEHKTSMREEVEREFYPEKYHFWPFGDPFIYKRKREAQKRKKEGRPAWQEDAWDD